MTDSSASAPLKQFAAAAIAAVICICALALAGWVLHALVFAGSIRSFIPMAPSTAIFFLVLCTTLAADLHDRTRYAARYEIRLAALAAAILSVAILSDYVIDTVHWNLEGLIFEGGGNSGRPSGRMSPITAAGFTVAGISVFLLSLSRGKRLMLRQIPPLLASLVTTIGLVLLLGYLQGSPFLYGGSIIPVAFPTAIAFFLFGLALCAAADPDTLPLSWFLGSSVRSRLMRAFLPVTAGIVFVDGLLYSGVYAKINNPSLISSLMTLASLFVVGLVIAAISKVIGTKIETAELERKVAEQKLSESEDVLRGFFENTIDAMFVGAPDGTIDCANPEASRIFGMTEEEIRTCGWRGLVEQDQLMCAVERMREGRYRGEFSCRRKDGTTFPVEVSSAIFVDNAGREKMTVTLRDTTERERLQKELQETNATLKRLSNTDPLTHLHNRRYLMESLDRELRRAQRNHEHLTVVMFDLDHFKLINDVFGHQRGDAVLVAVAEAARAVLRCYEIAARYGGEEFVLILPETDLDGGVVVAERLRQAVQALTFPPPMENLSVTISLGVTSYPSSAIASFEDLITRADVAMYRAKGNGRNRVELFAGPSIESWMPDTVARA